MMCERCKTVPAETTVRTYDRTYDGEKIDSIFLCRPCFDAANAFMRRDVEGDNRVPTTKEWTAVVEAARGRQK